MAEYRKVYGLGAEFDSAGESLMHAAEKIRDAGFKKWDVHTPFPVHGMDKAMGLGKSWLSARRSSSVAPRACSRPSLLTLHPVVRALSGHRPRQAVQLAHPAGVLPDHLRADGALLGVHDGLRAADHEPAAEVVSPGLQLGAFQDGHRRRLFPRSSRRAIRSSPKPRRANCSRQSAAQHVTLIHD